MAQLSLYTIVVVHHKRWQACSAFPAGIYVICIKPRAERPECYTEAQGPGGCEIVAQYCTAASYFPIGLTPRFSKRAICDNHLQLYDSAQAVGRCTLQLSHLPAAPCLRSGGVRSSQG